MFKIVIIKCTNGKDLYNLECCDQYLPLAPNSQLRTPTKITPDLIEQITKHIESGEYLYDKRSAPYEAVKDSYEDLWNEFKKDYHNYYYKNHYLPIRYLPDSQEFEVVIPTVGRPKTKKPVDVIKSIRIRSKLYEQLDNYCKTNNVSTSEAIRQALEQMFKNHSK